MTSPDSDDTDLTITVQDGSGGVTRWRLTCDPTGGTHPQAAAACRVLAARGEAAFRPVPKDRMCTEIYGGPETATVSGTYRGRRVLATYRRTNGCEIARWDSLAGLLPAVGSGI